MAVPQPATMPPKEIQDGTIRLSHKPGATVHYTLAHSPSNSRNILVVFLNGMASNKTTWLPIMAGVIRQQQSTSSPWPSMLSYDRYGQGLTTDPDPQNAHGEPGYGHSARDTADDLHHLITQVSQQKGLPTSQLVLVGNSMGGAIARLYAHEHPVAGVLLLDCVLANSDFDIYPNVDAPGFKVDMLPADVSMDQAREYRNKFLAVFSPSTKNREGLDRRSLPSLLPHSDRPMLGEPGKRPWVTVVGHDFDAFGDETTKLGIAKSLTLKYLNPYWHEYNLGLAKLTDKERSKGPFQAPGAGHFIQHDNPQLTISELLEMFDKIRQQ